MPRRLFKDTDAGHRTYGTFGGEEDARDFVEMNPERCVERPLLLAKIGECMAYWPRIDLRLAMLLAALMKADTAASVAVFMKLRRTATRADGIQAAAVLLEKRGQDLLAKIVKHMRRVEKYRNDLAHGYWGVCRAMSDAILWMSLESMTQHLIALRSPHEQTPDEQRGIHNLCYYYEMKDFDEILAQMVELDSIFARFTALVDNPNYATGPSREALYAEMESLDPLIKD